MPAQRKCPECWRRVTRTSKNNIPEHPDYAGKVCGCGGQPWRITLPLTRWRRPVEAAVEAVA